MSAAPALPASARPDASDGSWGAEMRAMVALGAPLVAANLLQMLVYSTDVIFVARLGERVLAASSLAVSLFALMMWCFSAVTGSSAALIAAELGRRRHAVREVRRSVRMALWLGVMLGLPGMVVAWNGERVLLLAGQDADLARAAGGFLRVLLWAMIPMIFSNVLRTFVSALGRPVFATAITAAAIGVNALGNWMFVFGHLGAPALGLNGSALASVLTGAITLAAYVLAIGMDRRLRRYHILGRWWRPEWTRLADLARIGLPIGMTVLAEAGLFSAAAFLMGLIGAAQLAGHTVALQIAALAFQVPMGLGQAATIRVGYHFGAGNALAAGRAGWSAQALALAFMAIPASLMLFAPRLLLSLYVDPYAAANAAMVAFAVQYMAVAAAFQLADGTQAVMAGALRGLQDTRVPMAIAIVGYWLPGMGTGVWLAFRTPLSGTGVWIGLAVGLLVVACLLGWRWMRREGLGLVAAMR